MATQKCFRLVGERVSEHITPVFKVRSCQRIIEENRQRKLANEELLDVKVV